MTPSGARAEPMRHHYWPWLVHVPGTRGIVGLGWCCSCGDGKWSKDWTAVQANQYGKQHVWAKHERYK